MKSTRGVFEPFVYKLCLLILFFSLMSAAKAQSPDTLFWLKNNNGIVEDTSGAVIRWENAIAGLYGDAVQPDPTLAGEQRQETYPGKVNVGFVKDGSFMTMEGSGTYGIDNAFTVFYAGGVGNVGVIAIMFGNFKVENGWGACSGTRFLRRANGNLSLQYARPGVQEIPLSNLPLNDFFFFGFSIDTAGNYSYFDNNSSFIKTGNIGGTIVQNTDDYYLNLARQANGDVTYDQTETAELMYFGETFNLDQMENARQRMMADYPELIKSDFSLDKVLPSDRTHLGISDSITLTFNQRIDTTSEFPKIYVNKSNVEASGDWSLTAINEITFTPSEPWPYGALVTLNLNVNLRSTDSVVLQVPSRSEYNFIAVSEKTYQVDTLLFSPMATVDFPQAGHQLPLKLVLPSNKTEKIPVHIWVHGGGWSGGTLAASAAAYSPHGDYLAENLGIASMGIAYRCHGSQGSFSLAMADIDSAYQWAMRNADTYNFDMTKVFFSGGSAGAPLAALAAQRYDGTVGLIGFNGIYDFVNDAGSFGQGNNYGQETPSAEANSAFYQLRADPPASIFMHGDNDNTIPLSQSTLFADQINRNGGVAKTVVYPGQPHAFFNRGKQEFEDVLYEMAEFMRDVLDSTVVSYNVDFTVTDGQSPISNAVVALEGYGTDTTNQAGLVGFNDVVPADSISYSVSASGYVEASGVVAITKMNVQEEVVLSPVTYQVSFVVSDGSSSVEGAEVSLTGYGSLSSDNQGLVVFTDVLPESGLSYEVTAQGFDNFSGTVTVDTADVVDTVRLNLTLYNVSFTITQSDSPLENAEVGLGSYGFLSTNRSGVVIFDDIAPDSIDYTVTYNGSMQKEGVLVVANSDVSETVDIPVILGGLVNVKSELVCYPVPADNFLYIKNEDVSPLAFYDLTGGLIKIVELRGQNRIDVSDLSEGFYVLKSARDAKLILIERR